MAPREIVMVNVREAGEIYVCGVCGNKIVVREAGGGELVCHGDPMERKVAGPGSS